MFRPNFGPFYEFYPTGQLQVEGFMKNGNCLYYASYTKYGTMEEEYIYDEEEYNSYTKKKYYPNGSIKNEYKYVDEKLNGRFVQYRINGIIKYDGFYHNGLRYGIWNQYNERGEKICEEHYRRNEHHGSFITYNNGQIIKETKFKYGYINCKVPPIPRLIGWFLSFKDKKYDYC